MEQLIKTWSEIGEENKLLFKKSLVLGIFLYILLLAIHDLLPYALLGGCVYILFKWLNQKNK